MASASAPSFTQHLLGRVEHVPRGPPRPTDPTGSLFPMNSFAEALITGTTRAPSARRSRSSMGASVGGDAPGDAERDGLLGQPAVGAHPPRVSRFTKGDEKSGTGKKRINREIREIGEERRGEDWKIRKRWKGREGRDEGVREDAVFGSEPFSLPYLLDFSGAKSSLEGRVAHRHGHGHGNGHGHGHGHGHGNGL